MFGTLREVDDAHWELRFERRLAHPIEKVWRAVTEPEHLARWFPSTIDGDRAAGAPLTFDFGPGVVDPITGEMLAFEPPHLMELRWGEDVLRLELAATDGGTTLVLTDTFGELGKAARDAAGWHECLDLLAHAVAGEAPAFELGDVWRAVHPEYQARLGAAASTIGPPAGHPVEQAGGAGV